MAVLYTNFALFLNYEKIKRNGIINQSHYWRHLENEFTNELQISYHLGIVTQINEFSYFM